MHSTVKPDPCHPALSCRRHGVGSPCSDGRPAWPLTVWKMLRAASRRVPRKRRALRDAADAAGRAKLAFLAGLAARAARCARSAVVLLQYNALSWSRRGFSVGALIVLRTLKRHSSRVGVIFHDAGPYPGTRLRDRVRRRVQVWVMRQLIKNSAKSICALPASCLPWFPSDYVKN